MVADSTIMDHCSRIAPWFSMKEGLKLLTLRWRLFLGHSDDVVESIIALKVANSSIMCSCRRTALGLSKMHG